MKRLFFLASFISLSLLCACTNAPANSSSRNMPIRALYAEETLYFDTGIQCPVEIDPSAILGSISSEVPPGELPTENGQSNFGSIGAEYAYLRNIFDLDGIVVMLDNEWTFFSPEHD